MPIINILRNIWTRYGGGFYNLSCSEQVEILHGVFRAGRDPARCMDLAEMIKGLDLSNIKHVPFQPRQPKGSEE